MQNLTDLKFYSGILNNIKFSTIFFFSNSLESEVNINAQE